MMDQHHVSDTSIKEKEKNKRFYKSELFDYSLKLLRIKYCLKMMENKYYIPKRVLIVYLHLQGLCLHSRDFFSYLHSWQNHESTYHWS